MSARSENQRTPGSVRRAELASTAMRVLAHRGAQDVSLSHVAAEAGITPSAIIYHWQTADALFSAAYEMAITTYFTERQRAIEGLADPAERLARLIHDGIPDEIDDAYLVLIGMVGRAAYDRKLAWMLNSLFEQQVGLYAAALEAGRATGQFSIDGDVRDAARALVGLEDGLGIRVLMGHPALGPDEARRICLQMAHDLVGCSLPWGSGAGP